MLSHIQGSSQHMAETSPFVLYIGHISRHITGNRIQTINLYPDQLKCTQNHKMLLKLTIHQDLNIIHMVIQARIPLLDAFESSFKKRRKQHFFKFQGGLNETVLKVIDYVKIERFKQKGSQCISVQGVKLFCSNIYITHKDKLDYISDIMYVPIYKGHFITRTFHLNKCSTVRREIMMTFSSITIPKVVFTLYHIHCYGLSGEAQMRNCKLPNVK